MIAASEPYQRAIDATRELLTKLRLDFMFVGEVARAAWLGGIVDAGAVDVVAIMQPQQKNQVVMMAANRGFGVEREEIEATEELDLIPLRVDQIRVRVLVASNALYARMVADAPTMDGLRVPTAEDLALLLALSDEHDVVRRLAAREGFDRARYNDKLTAIGLRELVV